MSEHIQFDGRTVAVIAPEDLEEMEQEIERLRGLSDITRLDVMWQELVKERYAAENNAAILSVEVQNLRSEIERLRAELAGADCIANGWQKQNLELRRLLRFFLENVPVKYYEGSADVMSRTAEILGHRE